MLPKRALRFSGWSFLLIGFVLLLTSFQGITGLSIIEDVDTITASVAGIWFILSGIVLLAIVGNKK